jgi:hypothetical protein
MRCPAHGTSRSDPSPGQAARVVETTGFAYTGVEDNLENVLIASARLLTAYFLWLFSTPLFASDPHPPQLNFSFLARPAPIVQDGSTRLVYEMVITNFSNNKYALAQSMPSGAVHPNTQSGNSAYSSRRRELIHRRHIKHAFFTYAVAKKRLFIRSENCGRFSNCFACSFNGDSTGRQRTLTRKPVASNKVGCSPRKYALSPRKSESEVRPVLWHHGARIQDHPI